ncbi:MAG: nitrogen fixation protein FixH [Alphaproteobacteria bacterium]|nr:nitrogen fixation protein FixH [Alphaproteobacteria bacterium]
MIRELKGIHVLLVLLAFFGTVIAVNVAMATYAVTTFSGEDVSDPYLKGLAFNKTLAAHSAQQKLEWTATIDAERQNNTTEVAVAVRDHNQREIYGLKVAVTFRRPTNANLDRTEALATGSDGTYSASIKNLDAGAWDIVARTTAPDGTKFEATRRVILR